MSLFVPIAPPAIPEIRILPPAPRFRDAVKIISTSVGAVASSNAVSHLVPRRLIFSDAVPSHSGSLNRIAEFGDLPVAAASGIPDGIVGSSLGSAPEPHPPVEVNKPDPPASIRIGGDVLAAKILGRVQPVYPQMARTARIEGVVRLLGVLNRDGRIESLQVISGHPLLVQAALEAVRQWTYSPTYLNGVPVEVQAPIEVRFTLSR